MSRLSIALRLLAASALLVAMVALFYQPLGRAWQRWLGKGGAAEATDAADATTEEPSQAAPPSFLLQVFSTPSQARVIIDGKDRGTTPAVTNIPCKTGQVVEVQVELAGHARWRRKLPCLPGESAVLEVKLER